MVSQRASNIYSQRSMNPIRNGAIRKTVAPGETYGRLTVVRLIGTAPSRGNVFLCSCVCGNQAEAFSGELRSGNKSSCGCLSSEKITTLNHDRRTHGLSKSRTYQSWMAMMNRCLNKKQVMYALYGAKGIKPCAAIAATPLTLERLIGERPIDTTLDRKNNELGYTCGECEECKNNGWPLNVRWATKSQQAANRRFAINITYNGKTLCLAQMAREMGISVSMLRARYRRGIRGDALFARAQIGLNWKLK